MKATVISLLLATLLLIEQSHALCPPGMRDYFRANNPLPAASQNSRWTDKFLGYRRYEDPAQFSTKKSQLLQAIERWSQISQRGILMRQMRRIRIKSFLREAFRIDDALSIAENLRPLFFKTQFSYYRYQRNARILEKLKNMPLTDAQIVRSQLEQLKSRENYDKTTIASERDLSAAVAREIRKLESEQISLTIEMARNIDEYSEATLFIEGVKNSSPPGSAMSQKAEFILNKLQGKYVVDSFLASIHRPKEKTPTLRKINEIIDREPIAEIRQLEQELTLERWTALVSRLPTAEIHLIMDRVLSKIPVLNKPEIRSFLRLSLDNRDILANYPKIDRLIEGEKKSDQVMWDYILQQDSNGRGSDSFLLTFARRADTVSVWRSLYEHGQKRKSELVERGLRTDPEVKFAEKMERINREASTLSPLPPWHHPIKSATLRYLIDGMMTVGALVLASYAYDSFFKNLTGDEASHDEESDLTSTVMDELEAALPQ